ncbi:protein translocase subunit SecF [Elusimicrobiota bacterium]
MQLKFLQNTNIDFLSKRYAFFIFSGILILAGALSLIIKGGPNYGIDFSGGLLVQVGFEKQVNLDEMRKYMDEGGIGKVELQSSRDSVDRHSVIIRTKQTDIEESEFEKKISEVLEDKFKDNQFSIDRAEYVGPAVGRHLSKQAFYAFLFAFVGMIIYVGFRFHSSVWGISAVIGIMHDVFIVFGIFSIFNKEISLTAIAAFLAIAGYSVNDTIVIFDRIRENIRFLAKEDLGAIINKSINQTLSRTMITSFTLIIVAVVLFFFGGEVIHDFAFAILIGAFVGTYSSIYVCSSIVYEWQQQKIKRTKRMLKTPNVVK